MAINNNSAIKILKLKSQRLLQLNHGTSEKVLNIFFGLPFSFLFWRSKKEQ